MHFFYGTLRHLPLLEAVAGRVPNLASARLDGHCVRWAPGGGFPVLVPDAAETVDGLVALDLTPTEVARLDFYEGLFGYGSRGIEVCVNGETVAALVYGDGPQGEPGGPFDLAEWENDFGALAVAAAGDAMALFGQSPAAEVGRRYHQILVRAASRLRAAQGGPVTLRRRADASDIEISSRSMPYANHFAVEDYDLRYRRFDGSMSETVTRAVFVSGDAATVLPYDPVRDRVLLIEQFRPGPFARGDAQPWLLEPIAGRVDPGESPEDAARREAAEEAGISLGALIPIGSYYPTPAAKSEYLYAFIGIAELPDGWTPGASGVADEHEDIRAHVVSFDRLMELVETGEAENGPLLLSALFLAHRRDRLRPQP